MPIFPDNDHGDAREWHRPCEPAECAAAAVARRSSPAMNGKAARTPPLLFTSCAPEQTFHRELVPDVAITRTGEHWMRRIALIGLALLAMTVSASARLGMAPIAAADGGVIQVKHGRGHGHGHMHAADAVTITGGTEAAVTISRAAHAITDKPSLDSLSSSHCPGDTRIAAARTGRAHAARPVQRSPNGRCALSRAPSPPRSGSGPNDSWRRASA